MKKSILAAYLAFASLLGAAAIASAETSEMNYKLYCSQCHGLNANGMGVNKADLPVAPRDHTNTSEMAKLKDSDMYNAIASGGGAVGKSTLMPGWKGVFSEEELKEMVSYLRKLCDCKGAE